MAALSLQGCVPAFHFSQDYVHELEYSFDGITHVIKTKVTCRSSQAVLSASDGRFHDIWESDGYNPKAMVEIAESFALTFPVEVKCNQPQQEFNQSPVVIYKGPAESLSVRLGKSEEETLNGHIINYLRSISRPANSNDRNIEYRRTKME